MFQDCDNYNNYLFWEIACLDISNEIASYALDNEYTLLEPSKYFDLQQNKILIKNNNITHQKFLY